MKYYFFDIINMFLKSFWIFYIVLHMVIKFYFYVLIKKSPKIISMEAFTMKKSRKLIALVLAVVMVFSLTSVPVFATSHEVVNTPNHDVSVMSMESGLDGFNQKLGCYNGPLYINVTGTDKTTGYITLRIRTSDQETKIYFNLYNPNGKRVLSRDFETGGPIYPSNGAEIKFSFNSAPAGTYRLEFTGVSGTSFDMLCWIYG